MLCTEQAKALRNKRSAPEVDRGAHCLIEDENGRVPLFGPDGADAPVRDERPRWR